jgi:site-specific DNA-methyltransferase (adenine-specific)
MIENYINSVINGDCIEVMKTLPENSIDLIVTSPPYGVNISYDVHDDDMEINEYLEFSRRWLKETYNILKEDGRIALNIPYEINRQEKGGRIFFVSEVYQVMKEIGFKFFGIVDLEEDSPHRSKTTAWGSWLSPSSPYIYNPKECVILAYKKEYKKIEKGVSSWDYTEELVEVEGKDGEPSTMKNKKIYSQEDKKEFMELVFGQWKYFADTKSLTKATYSLDIPMKAIKILTYKNDIVLDCFSGSGTTALAAKKLDRRYIGFELSPNYTEISKKRLEQFNM